MKSTITIIGGGIIGLAIAHRLLGEGATVTVIEAGTTGGGTTGAAAGMLCPGFELTHLDASVSAPFHRTAIASLAGWPALAEALRAQTGRDIDLRCQGALGLAQSAAHRDKLRALHERLAQLGRPVRWVSRRDIEACAPGLHERFEEGMLLPDEGQVDPRKTAAALMDAINGLGGVVLEQARAVAIDSAGGKVRGVRLADGRVIASDFFILAAGLAARDLWQEAAAAPLFAIKGQALSLSPLETGGCVIRTEQTYLCPKAGGRVVVGATEEAHVESLDIVENDIHRLHRGAADILPHLGDIAVTERWAGLRPTTPDRLPVIGRSSLADNLIYACGHYRNGILLAPATASLVSELIAGGPGEAAFAPQRFS